MMNAHDTRPSRRTGRMPPPSASDEPGSRAWQGPPSSGGDALGAEETLEPRGAGAPDPRSSGDAHAAAASAASERAAWIARLAAMPEPEWDRERADRIFARILQTLAARQRRRRRVATAVTLGLGAAAIWLRLPERARVAWTHRRSR